jgi:3-hydroxyisobutyrate dehydrogenase
VATVADVVVFDPAKARAEQVARDLEGRSVGDPATASREADAVIVVVVDATQTTDALLGASGAVPSMPEGAVVIVMSTIGPAAMRDIAERVVAMNRRVVDAPMTGGSALAERAELLVFASGEPIAFDLALPYLESCSREVRYVGAEPGLGQSAKLVNQLLCATHMIAAAEALALARSLGLDQHKALELVRDGAGASFLLEAFGARMIDGPYQPPASAVPILLKDAELVVAAAAESGLNVPLVDAARQVMQQGVSLGMSRDDISGVIRVYYGEEAMRPA